MFPIIFLLFVLMPIIEIYVIIQVGSNIGVLPTIALVVLTAVIGTAMLRAQGIATLQRFQGNLAQGQLPAQELMEGIVLLIGGALLLTPGFVTDAIGFMCLVPMTRQMMIKMVMKHGQMRVAGFQQHHYHYDADPNAHQGSRNARQHETIDGEFRRVDDD